MEGNLRIGDEWEAITILARSQPNPLKAVAELVENAVDARANNILIIRGKKKGVPFLSILDNGEGLHLNAEQEPDFHYVATHICDSMKRRLSTLERQGVQGEFGIGLLGFWTLGHELRMTAHTPAGEPLEMVMREGEQSFSVERPPRKELVEMKGVEVTITHLHPTTKHLLTGEKLQRYLAVELRDRIRQLGVRIEILDRIARKEFTVVPHSFQGERVARVQKIAVPGFGTARAEIYLNLDRDGQDHRIWVARSGTRITDDIRSLPGCDRNPWDQNTFEGIIDFPALTPSPGSRHGVVQDEAYTAFIQELEAVAGDLQDLLDRRSRTSQAERIRTVAREMRKVLTRAINSLPREEYPLLNTLRDDHTTEPLVEAAMVEREFDPGESEVVGGELAEVRIQPRNPWIPAGHQRRFTLLALDEEERPASGRFTYRFTVLEGPGEVTWSSGNQVQVLGREIGTIKMEAEASDGNLTRALEFPVRVGEERSTVRKQEMLPFYELVSEPGDTWRSSYVPERNAILINSDHPDFLWSQTGVRKQKHYLALLFCKELVKMTFPDADPETLLYRFVQLSGRIEF